MRPQTPKEEKPTAQATSLTDGELPVGWANARLSTLCDRQRGVSYARDDARKEDGSGLIPILRANNIDADTLNFDDLVYVPIERVSDDQRLRSGDIVIAMSSGSKSVVGKTAQLQHSWRGSFGAFCGVLRPHPEINSRFIGMFLRTREYRQAISKLAAGTNINNLKAEHFDAIEIPLPPLAEQRRIVAKLEALLSKVSTTQQRLSHLPTLLKRFRQSVLAAACSGRLTADWREENGDTEASTVVVAQLECAHQAAGGHKRGNAAPPTDEAHDLTIEELPTGWSLTELRSAVCRKLPAEFHTCESQTSRTTG